MKKLTKLIMILNLLMLFGLLATSCGKKAEADASSYQLVNLYGYECITNGVGIWCN